MTFGERIKEMRIKNSWSQSDLAKMVDVTERLISSWENNKVIPHRSNIEKLQKVLGIEDDFFDVTSTQVPLLIFKRIVKNDLVFEYNSWENRPFYEYVYSDLVNNEVFDENVRLLSQEELDKKYFVIRKPHHRLHVIKRDFKEIVDGKWYAIEDGKNLIMKKLFRSFDKKKWHAVSLDIDKLEEKIVQVFYYGSGEIEDLKEEGKNILNIETYSNTEKSKIVGIELATFIKLEK